MTQAKYQLGDQVRVVDHWLNRHYVGLVGEIVWIGRAVNDTQRYQIRTDTKPAYDRSKNPDNWIITVREDGIEPLANAGGKG